MNKMLSGLRALLRRDHRNAEIAEELRAFEEESIAEKMQRGMTRADAERAARAETGSAETVRYKVWSAGWESTAEGIWQDLRYGVRRLIRAPGFALTAIVTLALGIGANVVVFSVLDGLVLRPLGVPDAKNLYQVSRGQEGGDAQSYPDYRDFRDHDTSFSGLLGYEFLQAGMQIDGATARGWGYAATGNYFDVLGVQPALGRFFHAADEHGLASAPYVVLSYDFWRRQFGRSPSVVGKTVQLNHHPFTVIGVAAEGFRGTDVFYWPDYWVPLANAEQVSGWSDYCCRDHLNLTVMGRLKSGVTPQQATSKLNALATQMAKLDRKDDGLSLRLRVPGPAGDEDDPAKKGLLGIMLLAALMLLAACANLAGLFAARAADRAGELAVRMAIGATRWIVLRQLLTEAVLTSIAGGLLGSLGARALLGWLSTWQPFGEFPTRLPVLPDAGVYALAIALSVVSGFVFGVLPARQIWRTDVVTAIKAGFSWTESFRRFAFRDVLLLVQIAVCTLLVTASAVAVRGMQQAMHVPLGFDPAGVTVAQGNLNMQGYTLDNALPVQKRILDEAKAMPGVTSAALADVMPFGNGGAQWFVYRWGTTEFLPSHMAFGAATFLVSPEYLATAQTNLIAGRNFTWHDDKSAPAVAIVNQTFARMLFGNASPIGQRFALWATAKYEIVGEVEDGRYYAVGEKQQPMMMIPFGQGVGGYLSTVTTVLVRSPLPQDQVAAGLRALLSRNAAATPFTVRTWSDSVDLSMMMPRAVTLLLGAMGFLAAVLAMTGVFGMASYSVSKRKKEQGIRIALGAKRAQVMRAALGRPVLLLGCGSALGLLAGVLTSRVVARLGSFATPRDPWVLLSVSAAMVLIGLAATWLPARRVLDIDPARLLRDS
jgi:predicted permease